MTTTSHDNDTRALVSLTPEDIRTIRQGLRMLLQIHTRKEGFGAIRQALADLPDEEHLPVHEVGEELHTLACACRDASPCGDETPRAEAARGLPPRDEAISAPSHATRERVTLPVAGLACGGGGALTVERALKRTVGVWSVYVNPATETAYVEYDPRKTGLTSLKEAITSTGYLTEGGEA